MDKAIIAYYSFSGNTKALAEQIAAQTGGQLRGLLPITPYAFDYNTASKEARGQVARGFCPELAQGNESISQYKAVFVGTPNWFKSMAPPVLTFLRAHDYAGKLVIPFCTHGGGGFGEIESRIAGECPGAILVPGLAVQGEASPVQITDWLKAAGLL